MIRHPGRAGGVIHIHVGEQREDEEAAAGQPLTWLADPKALPYLDAQGNLVLPMNTPKRFRWWAGGQSVEQTMKELL